MRLMSLHHYLFALVAVTTSCVKPISTTKQVSQQEFQCDQQNPAQVAQAFSRVQEGMFQGWDPQNLELGKGLMASMPAEYLDHLNNSMAMAGFKISLVGNVVSCSNPGEDTSGVAGCTSLGEYPTFSDVRTDQVHHALIHELGHGLKFFVASNPAGKNSGGSGSFENDLDMVFNNEGRANGFVAGYARSTTDEYFAESFNTFYCSAEANNWIKSNLPMTADFLNRWLLPPTWTNPNSGNGQGGGGPFIPGGGPGNFNRPVAIPIVNASDIALRLDTATTPGTATLYAGTQPNVSSLQFCMSLDREACMNTGVDGVPGVIPGAVQVKLTRVSGTVALDRITWISNPPLSFQTLLSGQATPGITGNSQKTIWGVAWTIDPITKVAQKRRIRFNSR